MKNSIDAFGGGSAAAAVLAGVPADLLRIDSALMRLPPPADQAARSSAR